jgi:hypothetical protein
MSTAEPITRRKPDTSRDTGSLVSRSPSRSPKSASSAAFDPVSTHGEPAGG